MKKLFLSLLIGLSSLTAYGAAGDFESVSGGDLGSIDLNTDAPVQFFQVVFKNASALKQSLNPTLSGTHASSFLIVLDRCVSVGAGKNCVVTLSTKKSINSSLSATLDSANGTSLPLSLAVTPKTAPAEIETFSSDPAAVSVSFPEPGKSKMVTLSITNTGNISLKPEIQLPSVGVLMILNRCVTSLRPQASCQIYLSAPNKNITTAMKVMIGSSEKLSIPVSVEAYGAPTPAPTPLQCGAGTYLSEDESECLTNKRLLFRANEPNDAYGLWATDGTESGTVSIMKLHNGVINNVYPLSNGDFITSAYQAGETPLKPRIYKITGNSVISGGQSKTNNIQSAIETANGSVVLLGFFEAYDVGYYSGVALYNQSVDGAASNLLNQYTKHGGAPMGYENITMGNKVYFPGYSEAPGFGSPVSALLVADATTAQAKKVPHYNAQGQVYTALWDVRSSVVSIDDTVFFLSRGGSEYKIFKVENASTAASPTAQIAVSFPGISQDSNALASFDGRLLYNDSLGLHSYDPSSGESNLLVSAATKGSDALSYLYQGVVIGGKLYFSSVDALWETDGKTAAGTKIVHSGGYHAYAHAYKGEVYFATGLGISKYSPQTNLVTPVAQGLNDFQILNGKLIGSKLVSGRTKLVTFDLNSTDYNNTPVVKDINPSGDLSPILKAISK